MQNYITLGPAPCAENCAQVGQPDYRDRAIRECRAYIEAIRRQLGQEPEGAQLAVKSFPHDFGTYYEVVCHFDDAVPGSVEYAFRCEREAPQTWAEVGMRPPSVLRGRQR